jgi:hypothetical protein
MGIRGTEQNPFYSPHPVKIDAESIYKQFNRLRNGELDYSPQGCLERAKICHRYGLMVDPITGNGFWAMDDRG